MLSLTCVMNKRLSTQSWRWWFETPLRRHGNGKFEEHLRQKKTHFVRTTEIWYMVLWLLCINQVCYISTVVAVKWAGKPLPSERKRFRLVVIAYASHLSLSWCKRRLIYPSRHGNEQYVKCQTQIFPSCVKHLFLVMCGARLDIFRAHT